MTQCVKCLLVAVLAISAVGCSGGNQEAPSPHSPHEQARAMSSLATSPWANPQPAASTPAQEPASGTAFVSTAANADSTAAIAYKDGDQRLHLLTGDGRDLLDFEPVRVKFFLITREFVVYDDYADILHVLDLRGHPME